MARPGGVRAARRLREAGFTCPVVSVGSTPTAPVATVATVGTAAGTYAVQAEGDVSVSGASAVTLSATQMRVGYNRMGAAVNETVSVPLVALTVFMVGVISVENEFAWAGPLRWRMDNAYRLFRDELTRLRRPPSEYFDRNCFIGASTPEAKRSASASTACSAVMITPHRTCA